MSRLTPRVPCGLAIRPTAHVAPSYTLRNHSSNNGPSSPFLITHLECERKFIPTDLLRTRLDTFKNIQNLRFEPAMRQDFHDKYYDLRGTLLDRGIWLRWRTEDLYNSASGEWEAKMSIGEMAGDFINSKFEEVSGERESYAAIKKRLPSFSLMDLKLLRSKDVTVAISTKRAIWKANCTVGDETTATKFVIVLDKVTAASQTKLEAEMPLEHVIGEVELTKTLHLSGDEEANKKTKQEELARMDGLIEELMMEKELFPTQPAPIGKLSAYFQWKKTIEKEQKRRELEEARLRGV